MDMSSSSGFSRGNEGTGEIPAEYSFSQIVHKKTLILGDVSTGKTSFTARLLLDALSISKPEEITVIDMAPERMFHDGKVIGGKITDMVKLPSTVRILQPKKVYAPRHSAKNRDELLRQVEQNATSIEESIGQYLNDVTPILFINDLSLYFQSGRFEKAFKAMDQADTFAANAYYGTTFRNDLGTGVSETERRIVETIAKKADLLIHLKH